VYNKKRLHSSIGHVPPQEYEAPLVVKDQNKKAELLPAISNHVSGYSGSFRSLFYCCLPELLLYYLYTYLIILYGTLKKFLVNKKIKN
jgi:hypothetical protein